ncbi:metabolite transport protein [Escherichia coli]|nr:metabolite transport protein [Escherichia coli]
MALVMIFFYTCMFASRRRFISRNFGQRIYACVVQVSLNAVGRIVAVFTPYGVAALLTHYGSITVFIVLGVMLVLCALVLSIFGIETRKVSLEEISEVN